MKFLPLKPTSIGLALFASLAFLMYWYPRFLVEQLGISNMWTSYLYQYGMGFFVFSLGSFIVFKTGSFFTGKKLCLFILSGSFLYFFILHGLIIYFAISVPTLS